MIVRKWTEGRLLLLRQVDHAHLAGEMAARLAEPPEPRGAFVAGTREHDNGWLEADQAPVWHERTRRPSNYTMMPEEPYLALWRRSIERAGELDPHVGILVALHGHQFFRRKTSAHARGFHRWTDAQVALLLERLDLDGSAEEPPPFLHRQFEHVRWLDGLSLFACEGWPSPWEGDLMGARTEVSRRNGIILVEPWPFATSDFSLEVPAFEIPDRDYADQDDLDEAWRGRGRTRLRLGFARA